MPQFDVHLSREIWEEMTVRVEAATPEEAEALAKASPLSLPQVAPRRIEGEEWEAVVKKIPAMSI